MFKYRTLWWIFGWFIEGYLSNVMSVYPRTWAEIDLGALAQNVEALKQELGPTNLCLVVKADGYGHGLVSIARQALRHGADWLAVATVGEGVALRDSGIEAPVLILSPILPIEADQALFYRLDVTVESAETAQEMGRVAVERGTKARLHLKVDTGLSRFGCKPNRAADILGQLWNEPGIEWVGLSTHLVDSRTDPSLTIQQVELFHQTVSGLIDLGLRPPIVHCANSGGAILHPDSRFDMARVGLHAYGLDPEGKFKTVMTLWSRVVAERWIEAGERVGYMGTWVAESRTRVLTVASGYGDGIPRRASNNARVWLADQECPVIGLVCMDLLMIDATHVPSAKIGDPVQLIGPLVHPARLAAWAGTNTHEIVTRIAPRVPRRLINADWRPG